LAYYDVLGVDSQCTMEEVKKAYRRLAIKVSCRVVRDSEQVGIGKACLIGFGEGVVDGMAGMCNTGWARLPGLAVSVGYYPWAILPFWSA
jgi:hypothetical protein